MKNFVDHYPVLYREMLEYTAPKDNDIYVDGTFGAGGYSKLLLDNADCKLYAIDRDHNVQKYADNLKIQYGNRFVFCPGEFANMKNLINQHGIEEVDGIVLDIGVSSMQLDEKDRGFAFSHNGPLDMRMDNQSGISAREYINSVSEKELANIIFNYGGEKKSRIIARKIVENREKAEITTTKELADIIRSAVGRYNDKIDPATRTFQAIRIEINNELEQLQRALESAKELLADGGRLVVVTFHSLEDKIVKKFFRDNSGYSEGTSRHRPDILQEKNISFEILTRKAVSAQEDELNNNPRSRSAKLRAALRVRK